MGGDTPLITEQSKWLIEGLWAEQAVGILGGEPKKIEVKPQPCGSSHHTSTLCQLC